MAELRTPGPAGHRQHVEREDDQEDVHHPREDLLRGDEAAHQPRRRMVEHVPDRPLDTTRRRRHGTSLTGGRQPEGEEHGHHAASAEGEQHAPRTPEREQDTARKRPDEGRDRLERTRGRVAGREITGGAGDLGEQCVVHRTGQGDGDRGHDRRDHDDRHRRSGHESGTDGQEGARLSGVAEAERPPALEASERRGSGRGEHRGRDQLHQADGARAAHPALAVPPHQERDPGRPLRDVEDEVRREHPSQRRVAERLSHHCGAARDPEPDGHGCARSSSRSVTRPPPS
jgi:hypothetical protein